MRKYCNIYCLHILQSVEPHNEKKPHIVTDSRKETLPLNFKKIAL